MKTQPVKDILEFLKDESLFAQPGEINILNYEAGVFRAPSMAKGKNPLIVVGALEYSSDTIKPAVESWKRIVKETAHHEEFVGMYTVTQDQADPNRVFMIEAYDDQSAFDKHCGTEILQQQLKDNNALIAKEPRVFFLKHVAGFYRA